MSVCSTCRAACNIPLCTDEIIIGTISSISADVYILIENQSTGRKQAIATQSDNTGKVTLVTDGLGLMAGQTYEISVILNTGALCDNEILYIGEETATCVLVIFDNVLGTDGCQVNFSTQTITLIPSEEMVSNCHSVCLLAKSLNVDFSSTHTFNFSYESGRSLSNILPLYARIEWKSGDYSDTNAQLSIADTPTMNVANVYFNDLTAFDNTFSEGIRKIAYITSNPMNLLKTALLTATITGSANPDCTADIYIYGIKI